MGGGAGLRARAEEAFALLRDMWRAVSCSPAGVVSCSHTHPEQLVLAPVLRRRARARRRARKRTRARVGSARPQAARRVPARTRAPPARPLAGAAAKAWAVGAWSCADRCT
eukprot:NODE_8540_length_378_cov_110.482972.p1 GENE.NODE_8540_length_378_cov_110.482972~~NODE_8540_length_378_cov_110.482972.p1  ORF type:complete len:111 (+),score=11.16 NODE_8540_length_378_cov_110.482972:3-335(+)